MARATGRRTFRNTVFRIHTWLGLHFCILFGVIFATGLLLLFSPELTHYRHPSLWISAPADRSATASPGQIYDTVQAERPGARIDIIGGQPRPWFGRPVYGAGGDSGGGGKRGAFIAHVNPYDGSFMGYYKKGRLTLRDALRKLHDSLLAPFYTVRVMVNALSFVLLAIVVAGLITYRRFWKGFFRRPAPGANARARAGALHRLAAVWTAPFLLIAALSGAVFFLNAVGLKAVVPKPPAVAERADRLPAEFDGAALDGILAGCRDELPGFTELGVNFPKTGAEPIKIHGYDPAVGKLFGAATCYGDPASGTALQVSRASDGNWMVPVKALALALHHGTWAGWYSIGLWLVFSAGSLYLLVSGARVFASRSITQRDPQAGDLSGRSTLSLVIDGLGMFKWAYLALLLAILAMIARPFL